MHPHLHSFTHHEKAFYPSQGVDGSLEHQVQDGNRLWMGRQFIKHVHAPIGTVAGPPTSMFF